MVARYGDHEMKRRIFAMGVFAMSACCTGCGGGSCHSTFLYHIKSTLPDGNYANCEIDFDAGHKVARYTVATPCAKRRPAPVVEPVGDSPIRYTSEAYACVVTIDYDDNARDLANYVGSDTCTMTVTCDGKVVKTQPVVPLTQVCAL